MEVIFDIECDLPIGQDFALLEQKARNCYLDKYPTFRPQILQQHEVKLSPAGGSTPQISSRNGITAYRFLQKDEKQIVQVRSQGFSFNRLAPYTSLDDYLPEIERTWRLYVELAEPVKVRYIKERYINRIMIPLRDAKVDLDNYLKIGPKVPDESRLVLRKFLHQHSAVDSITGSDVNIILTAQEPESNRVPIILDVSVTSLLASDPENWELILDKIKVLRDLKNHIFINSVTEPCLSLFH